MKQINLVFESLDENKTGAADLLENKASDRTCRRLHHGSGRCSGSQIWRTAPSLGSLVLLHLITVAPLGEHECSVWVRCCDLIISPTCLSCHPNQSRQMATHTESGSRSVFLLKGSLFYSLHSRQCFSLWEPLGFSIILYGLCKVPWDVIILCYTNKIKLNLM